MDEDKSLIKRTIPVGLIYTMNITEEQLPQFGVDKVIANTERLLTLIFGRTEILLCTDTFQFGDYAKYAAPVFDPAHKARRRQQVFPRDLEKAFKLGKRLVAR